MKEYCLPSIPIKKSKLTIGFLDEVPYVEFQNQKMAGVLDAARKYDANIIRFSDYTTADPSHYNSTQVKMVLDHIAQYPLDGLIFIGWINAVNDDFADFTRRFASIPLLGLGKTFENIPHVYFSGDQYIREILLHLINVHHLKRIAFIAPIRADERNEVYIATMKEYGIYNPELYVDIPEDEYSAINGRARRALTILLDERKVNLEAIMSMYNEETIDLLYELKLRGIKVPQDLAVTSYEDGETGKYSYPALTTVNYPFYDLGFYGFEKMIQLLTQGRIPFCTQLLGHTIYRNSCGCSSNAVKSAGNCSVDSPAGTLETMTTVQKKAIIEEMTAIFPHANLDFAKLLAAFLNDYQNRSGDNFIHELMLQIRNFPYGFNNLNIKNLITEFRRYLFPFLTHQEETILWSGDIFQQAQILVLDKLTSIDGQEKVNFKIFNQAMQDISQILVADFSIGSLMDSLAESLPKLLIPGCYIFISNSVFCFEDHNPDQCFHHCILAFEYRDNYRLRSFENQPVDFKCFFDKILAKETGFRVFLTHVLHVSNNFIGFMIYEPGPADEKIYRALSDHISTTLYGSILLKKLEYNYQKLAEQAHREGMADISTDILHNMGNMLNSINTSVGLMKDTLNSPAFSDFGKASALLRMNIHDLENFIHHHPKSEKLWQFLFVLDDSFQALKKQLHYHLNRMNQKVSSINEIITAQQNYAGIPEITEDLDLASVLEDALKLHAITLNNYQIQVIRDYRCILKVPAKRIRIFYVLVQLISNAIEAMLETPPGERRLQLNLNVDNQGKYIRVTDSGCGIAASLLEKIFEYGYTTKENGKGLGLHSCAGYMAEMGGHIRAESNGPGTGATFVVEFH